METPPKPWTVRLAVLGVLVFAYFVCYPQDLAALLNPVERLLGVSNALSPGQYGVIGIAILSWTMVRIWGSRRRAETDRNVPST